MLIAIDDPDVGSFELARTTSHLSAAPEFSDQPGP